MTKEQPAPFAKGDEWHNDVTRGYILVTEVAQTKRGERVRFHFGQINRQGEREKWGQLSRSVSEFDTTVSGMKKVKR